MGTEEEKQELCHILNVYWFPSANSVNIYYCILSSKKFHSFKTLHSLADIRIRTT